MRIIIFGATGMVGQGVLRECLLDAEIDVVLTVGRAVTGQKHEKLREIAQADLLDLSGIENELAGYDGCFFCLGVSSAGTPEAEYARITFSIPVAVATTLVRLNPGMTFVYVSGAGADSTEKGRTMWARVKGKAENALLAMAFKSVYIIRPAFIQPLHGIRSRTRLYTAIYAVIGPLYPVLKAVAPGYATTTEELGRAMIAVVKRGAPRRVLESSDIGRVVLPTE